MAAIDGSIPGRLRAVEVRLEFQMFAIPRKIQWTITSTRLDLSIFSKDTLDH